MDAKEVIELYARGMMDEEGELVPEVIQALGNEDGQAYGHVASVNMVCGEERQLVSRAAFVQEMAADLNSQDTMFLLICMAKCLDEELAEEMINVSMDEDVLDIYVPAFLSGFHAVIKERCLICKACRK